jgi:hypothetical protein
VPDILRGAHPPLRVIPRPEIGRPALTCRVPFSLSAFQSFSLSVFQSAYLTSAHPTYSFARTFSALTPIQTIFLSFYLSVILPPTPYSFTRTFFICLPATTAIGVGGASSSLRAGWSVGCRPRGPQGRSGIRDRGYYIFLYILYYLVFM